jgi:ABC-type molybdate transport system substrate-binding protein
MKPFEQRISMRTISMTFASAFLCARGMQSISRVSAVASAGLRHIYPVHEPQSRIVAAHPGPKASKPRVEASI